MMAGGHYIGTGRGCSCGWNGYNDRPRGLPNSPAYMVLVPAVNVRPSAHYAALSCSRRYECSLQRTAWRGPSPQLAVWELLSLELPAEPS